VREFHRPGKNEGMHRFISVGAKSYKYAFGRTNFTQFTHSFHSFAYVEPLRKSLNLLGGFFIVLNKVVDVLNAKKKKKKFSF
jgi:hypothetical protein